LIKIGQSKALKERMSTLQSGCPDILQLIGLCLSSYKKEKVWHEEFKEFRRHGEWFNLGPEEVKKIPLLKKPILLTEGKEKFDELIRSAINPNQTASYEQKCRIHADTSMFELQSREQFLFGLGKSE